ncbi:hypothetical protein [Methylobacterium planeticum]|uniref:Uncharacterized protein n=1 Tax=Methylobacterium planeticum TaxID=2615211 RepID=A0A6N6MSW4_9HYPH|nr:hypothetical protein [Methylobacterium planeticum]KAB1071750.1 hypothetical protein F6X51_18230 [Methylobacterium planeticum]
MVSPEQAARRAVPPERDSRQIYIDLSSENIDQIRRMPRRQGRAPRARGQCSSADFAMSFTEEAKVSCSRVQRCRWILAASLDGGASVAA